jgi:serine/threonine protein phosphatase PrpC
LFQAVNFVRRRLLDHSDVQRVAQELVDKALSLASNDNVSALVIALNQGP